MFSTKEDSSFRKITGEIYYLPKMTCVKKNLSDILSLNKKLELNTLLFLQAANQWYCFAIGGHTLIYIHVYFILDIYCSFDK